MQVLNNIESLHHYLGRLPSNARVALVPTMGNLHAGHLSLVDKAKALADVVLVSIFVNPIQFAPGEDFDRYPRTEAEDIKKLTDAGVQAVFLPTVEALYPDGIEGGTRVLASRPLAEMLCGASRPGHFDGVVTVVAKLFNLIQPDLAVFGEKDFQQLAIIRRMVADLNFPVEIISVPTVREPDGLAMSSRNSYLNAEERSRAAMLYGCLRQVGEQVAQGARDMAALEASAEQRLRDSGFVPDYFRIQDADTLAPLHDGSRRAVILAAAYLGHTRLIDNLVVSLPA